MAAQDHVTIKVATDSPTKQQSRVCCGCKKWQCCLCCCGWCCCVLVSIALAIAVIAAMFKKPELTVQRVTIRDMSVTGNDIIFYADILIHLRNPNGWPISGSVKQLHTDIWSLDNRAADLVGQIYYLGQASLPQQVGVGTNSQVDFTISTAITIPANSSTASLSARFTRDCGPLAGGNQEGMKETRLRFLISDTVASVARIPIDLRGVTVPLETNVTCGQASTPSGLLR